jgi:spermidine synthase
VLETAQVPDGGELRLKRRGAEFSIMLGNIELMNSRIKGSEEALATMSCGRLANRSSARVLIGGLGMGFTFRAALAALGPEARITVAEIVPAVVRWARGPMATLFGESLSDPRVSVCETDVRDLIKAPAASYDAILLDVDNGPDGLTREANDCLYDANGLSEARNALNPGGILAVWSSRPDGNFTERLRAAGFLIDEVRVRANGARHVLWFAKRPAAFGGKGPEGWKGR